MAHRRKKSGKISGELNVAHHFLFLRLNTVSADETCRQSCHILGKGWVVHYSNDRQVSLQSAFLP